MNEEREVTFQHTAHGVVLTTKSALCPKLSCNRVHVHYWAGSDPEHPAGTFWSEDPADGTVYPTEVEAADAFAAIGGPWYRLPPPQLQLFTGPTR